MTGQFNYSFFTGSNEEEGDEVVVKIRLSTNSKDVKLTVRTTDTVSVAKKKLEVSSIICY